MRDASLELAAPTNATDLLRLTRRTHASAPRNLLLLAGSRSHQHLACRGRNKATEKKGIERGGAVPALIKEFISWFYTTASATPLVPSASRPLGHVLGSIHTTAIPSSPHSRRPAGVGGIGGLERGRQWAKNPDFNLR